MTHAAEEELPRPASPGDLLRTFNRMSLQGFGGVLPVVQHTLVVRQRWLSRAEFVEILALGQVLPGPNIVNMAVMIGDRFFGIRGALAACVGLLAAPTLIIFVLAAVYAEYAQVPWVAGALRGVGAVAAGLVISTALRLLPTLERNPMGGPTAALAGLATLGAIAGMRWPLLNVIGGLGGLSVLWAWVRLDR